MPISGFQPWGVIVALLVAVVVFGPARVIRFSQAIAARLRGFLADATKMQEEFVKGLTEEPGPEPVPTEASAAEKKEPSLGQQLAPHVLELRSRLVISFIAILIAVVITFVFADNLIALLKQPSGNITLNVFNILDSFFIKWRVALFGGLALSSPVWLFQLVSFISPGLTARERQVILPLIIVACLLFALGVAFGYYLLYGMIQVLTALFGPQLNYLPSASDYISFVTFFLLATGISFEMPVVLYALVQLGILSTDTMRRQRKYFYFGMFVFAEIVTPVADPIVAPMTIMLPLVVLYEITVFFARLAEKRRAPTEMAGSKPG